MIILQDAKKKLRQWNTEVGKLYETSVNAYFSFRAIFNGIVGTRIDDPNINMEEYIRLEEEKAQKRGKVLNMVRYENDNERVNMPLYPSPEPSVSCINDLDFFKDFENEFPAIVYYDALTSKSDFSIEPTLCPQHIDEFDLKNETSLSEYDEVEQNVLYFNDLFPFNIIYPDDLKSDKGDDDNEIDMIQSSGGNENTQGSNKLLEASHDKINKVFIMKSFVMELNVNIVAWNYLVNGMLLNLIKNLLSIRRIQTPWIWRIDLLDVIQSLFYSTVDTTYSLNEYSVFDTCINRAYPGEPSERKDLVDCIFSGILLIKEYFVKISKKARILELKRRYFKDYCSGNQYAVSIKEDTAYLCLHSPKDH
ncbi:hypothetical protein Tco_1120890 [Tanacetum coccineum]|uniref:Uncharacterized protein n=1 Tax=Tanacetum coccineum TaxID=301880 RepID=A0ABQ5IXM9_9ASTR